MVQLKSFQEIAEDLFLRFSSLEYVRVPGGIVDLLDLLYVNYSIVVQVEFAKSLANQVAPVRVHRPADST